MSRPLNKIVKSTSHTQQANAKPQQPSSGNQKNQNEITRAESQKLLPKQQSNSAKSVSSTSKNSSNLNRTLSARTLQNNTTIKPSQSKESSPARIQKVQKVTTTGDAVVTQEIVKSQKTITSKINSGIKKREGTLNTFTSNTRIERPNSRSKSREKKPEQKHQQKPKQLTVAEKLAIDRSKKLALAQQTQKSSKTSKPSSGQVSRNSSPLSKDSKGSSQKQQKLSTSRMAPKQVIHKLEKHTNDLLQGKKDIMKKKQEELSAGSKQQSDEENQFHNNEDNTTYPKKFPTITITQCSDPDILQANQLSNIARFENQEDEEDLMSENHNNQHENGELNNSIDEQDINLDDEQLRQEQILIENQLRQQQQNHQDFNEIEDNQFTHQVDEDDNQDQMDQNYNNEDQQNDDMSINDDVESQQIEESEDIRNSQAFTESQMNGSQKFQEQNNDQYKETDDYQQAEPDKQISEPELEKQNQEVEIEKESELYQENVAQDIKPQVIFQEQNMETQEITEMNPSELIKQNQGLENLEESQRIAERLITIQEEEEAARLNTEVFEMQSNQTGSPIMLNELKDDSNNNSEIQSDQLVLDKDVNQGSKKDVFESEQQYFFVKKCQQISNFIEDDDQLLADQDGQEDLQEQKDQNSQIQQENEKQLLEKSVQDGLSEEQQVNQENKQKVDQPTNNKEILNNEIDQNLQDLQGTNENIEKPEQYKLPDNCNQFQQEIEQFPDELHKISEPRLNNSDVFDKREATKKDENQTFTLNQAEILDLSNKLLEGDSSPKNSHEQQNLNGQRPLILVEDSLAQINQQNVMDAQNNGMEEQNESDQHQDIQNLEQRQEEQNNSKRNEIENKSQGVEKEQNQLSKNGLEAQNFQQNQQVDIQNDQADEDFDFLKDLQNEFIHNEANQDDEDVSPDNKVPQNEYQDEDEVQQQDDNKITLPQDGNDNQNLEQNVEEQLIDQEQNNPANILENSKNNQDENKPTCICQAQDQLNKDGQEIQNSQQKVDNQNEQDDEDFDFLADLQKEFIHEEVNQQDNEDVSPDNKVPQNEDQDFEENQQQEDNKIALIDQNNQPEIKQHQNVELMQENETIEEEDQDAYSEESFLIKRKNQSHAISPNMQIPKKLEQNEISLQIEKEPFESQQQSLNQIEQEITGQVLEMEVEEKKEENKQMEIQNQEVQQDNLIQQEVYIEEKKTEENIEQNNEIQHDQQNIIQVQLEVIQNQQIYQEEMKNEQEGGQSLLLDQIEPTQTEQQNIQQNELVNDSQLMTDSRNDIRECNNTQVEETQQLEPITMRVTNSNNRTELLESQFQSQDNIRNLMISDNYDQIGGQFYIQQNQENNHKSFDAGVFMHVEQRKQTISENCNIENINLSAQFQSSPNQDQQNEIIDSSRFDGNGSLQQQQQEVYQTPLRQRTIRSEDLNSGRSRISNEAEFKDSPDKQQSQLDFKPEEFQSQRTQENFSKQEEFGDTGRESFNYINKNTGDRSLDSQPKQLESRKSSNEEQQDQIEPNLRHHQKIPMLRLPPSNHNNIEKDDKMDTCRTVESLINKFGQQSDHDHQNLGQEFSTPTQQPLFSNHSQGQLGSQMKKKQQKPQPLDMLFDIEESITPEQQARSVNPTPKQVDSKKHQKNTMSFGLQQDFQKMYVNESPNKSQSGLFSRQSPLNQRVELLQISQKREEDLKKTIKQEKNLKKRKEEQEQRERENKILSEKKKKQDELDQRIIQLERDLQLKIEINKSRDSEIFDCEQRYQNYIKKIDEISINENKDEESYIQNTYNFIDDFKNQMYEKISNMKHQDPLVELMKTRFKTIYKDQFLKQQEQQQIQQIEYNLQNNCKQTQTEIVDLRIKTLVTIQPVYIVLKEIFDHLITLRAHSHNVGQSFLQSQKDSYKNMLQLSKRKAFRERILELTKHLNYEIEESIKYLNSHQQTFQLLEIKELIANDISVQDKLHDTICSLSDIFRERLMQIQEGEKAMMENFSSLYKTV